MSVEHLRENVVKRLISRRLQLDEASSPPNNTSNSGSQEGGTKSGGGSKAYIDGIGGLEGDTGIIINNVMTQAVEAGLPIEILKQLWDALLEYLEELLRRQKGIDPSFDFNP